MNPELPALITEATAIAADAESAFARLTRDQLNWKPAADEWSVAQCFDHLIKINSTYFPQWRRIEEGAYRPTWRDRVPLLARFFGLIVLRAVQPASKRKFKAAKHVEPSSSAIDGDIIARFTSHQHQVIQHMTLAGSRDATAIIITSPVAPIAYYSLLDAFRIIVAHERRHMAQAARVVRADGFPSSS